MKLKFILGLLIVFVLNVVAIAKQGSLLQNKFPKALNPIGDGYLYEGDPCHKLGESQLTSNYLDHTQTLVGCPKNADMSIQYIIKSQKAIKINEISGISIFSIPNTEIVGMIDRRWKKLSPDDCIMETLPGDGDFKGFCHRKGNKSDLVAKSPLLWGKELDYEGKTVILNHSHMGTSQDGVWVEVTSPSINQNEKILYDTRIVRTYLIQRKFGGEIFWWPEEFGITYVKNSENIGMAPIMPEYSSTFYFQGTITGKEDRIHSFKGHAGDSVCVTMTGANNSVFFNIIPDLNYSSALFVGRNELNPNSWNGKLPKDGKYSILVYQLGNDRDTGRKQSYKIQVIIRSRSMSNGINSAD